MCWEWTWYLSNDYQFFLVTAPLLLAVAYGLTRPVVLVLLVMIAGCICLGAYSELGITNFNHSYFRPWNRCAPYFWGVLAALLFQNLKARAAATVPHPRSELAGDDESHDECDPFFEEDRSPHLMTQMLSLVHTTWARWLGYGLPPPSLPPSLSPYSSSPLAFTSQCPKP